MRWLRRLLLFVLLTALLAAGLCAGAVWWWLRQPLPLASATAEVSIEPGVPARRVAELWVDAGVQLPPRWLYEWFRWSGQSRQIRAGSYQIDAGTTPRQLLDKMVRGDQVLETVRFVEGSTFAQMRDVLAHAPALKPATRALSDTQIMAALGEPALSPEGRFFPDTYAYSRGVSDLTVLRRAFETMQRRLITAWAERAVDVPLASMDEALILASIIEKETGREGDRGLIAGVFHNRMRIGMPLQTDPTVIYGLGSQFDGNLRKRDLLADTPFNTYTRRGLPPTPIAMPGAASLRAAVQPAPTHALYFVARSDGSGGSVFSDSLTDHNRAVNVFQRGGKPAP